jgi:glutathione S-transferase
MRKPAEERDSARIAKARQGLVESLGRLEERLSRRAWLVGEAMSMYDVILGCTLIAIRPPPAFVEESVIYRFYQEHMGIQSERPRVTEWVGRVLAHDTGRHRTAAH